MKRTQDMTDRERSELAQLMVATLPKYGTWASAFTVFKTPLGKIGYRQAAILWAIRYQLIPEDEVSPSRLATLYHVQPSAITRALARLEEGGFISRTTDPKDGRGFRVTMTDKGRQVSEFVEHLFNEDMLDTLSCISDEQVLELRRSVEILDRLVDDLERKRTGRSGR
jgi:DNA-binding MarR family transcriptional regulator